MNTAPLATDLSHIDMAEIEKRARRLRAVAVQDFVTSVKTLIMGLAAKAKIAPKGRVSYGAAKGTGAFL